MNTITTDHEDFNRFLSDFCGTPIETLGDLIRAADLCGLQPSDILSAAQNLYQRGWGTVAA